MSSNNSFLENKDLYCYESMIDEHAATVSQVKICDRIIHNKVEEFKKTTVNPMILLSTLLSVKRKVKMMVVINHWLKHIDTHIKDHVIYVHKCWFYKEWNKSESEIDLCMRSVLLCMVTDTYCKISSQILKPFIEDFAFSTSLSFLTHNTTYYNEEDETRLHNINDDKEEHDTRFPKRSKHVVVEKVDSRENFSSIRENFSSIKMIIELIKNSGNTSDNLLAAEGIIIFAIVFIASVGLARKLTMCSAAPMKPVNMLNSLLTLLECKCIPVPGEDNKISSACIFDYSNSEWDDYKKCIEAFRRLECEIINSGKLTLLNLTEVTDQLSRDEYKEKIKKIQDGKKYEEETSCVLKFDRQITAFWKFHCYLPTNKLKLESYIRLCIKKKLFMVFSTWADKCKEKKKEYLAIEKIAKALVITLS